MDLERERELPDIDDLPPRKQRRTTTLPTHQKEISEPHARPRKSQSLVSPGEKICILFSGNF
jgi:hypothetical protein